LVAEHETLSSLRAVVTTHSLVKIFEHYQLRNLCSEYRKNFHNSIIKTTKKQANVLGISVAHTNGQKAHKMMLNIQ
jgi:hypothetical protein